MVAGCRSHGRGEEEVHYSKTLCFSAFAPPISFLRVHLFVAAGGQSDGRDEEVVHKMEK